MFTKKDFIEKLENLTEEQFKDLLEGINQVTFEWGWGRNGLDDTDFILAIWRANQEG